MWPVIRPIGFLYNTLSELVLIIEGATENVSQFIMPLISKKVFSKEQKLLEHGRKVKTISNLYNYNIFVFETFCLHIQRCPL